MTSIPLSQADSALLLTAQTRVAEATHFKFAYGERAAQLTRWQRATNFIGIGLGPCIFLLTGTGFADPGSIWHKLAIGASSLLGVLSFGWSIYSLTNQLDAQLRACIDIQSPVEAIETKFAEARPAAIEATSVSSRADAIAEIRHVIDEAQKVIARMNNDQVHVGEHFNIFAAQRTLPKYAGVRCPFCNQPWQNGAEIFSTLNEAKAFLRDVRAKKLKRCKRCAQPAPTQSHPT